MIVNSKVDGRKFNKPGVKKAEHEKVRMAQLLDSQLSSFDSLGVFAGLIHLVSLL